MRFAWEGQGCPPRGTAYPRGTPKLTAAPTQNPGRAAPTLGEGLDDTAPNPRASTLLALALSHGGCSLLEHGTVLKHRTWGASSLLAPHPPHTTTPRRGWRCGGRDGRLRQGGLASVPQPSSPQFARSCPGRLSAQTCSRRIMVDQRVASLLYLDLRIDVRPVTAEHLEPQGLRAQTKTRSSSDSTLLMTGR